MNLPNKLTLTRILLVPVFMVFVSLTSLSGIADGSFQPTYYLIAGIVFAAASFTDFLDGHLARKWNMVTDFGKFADPLADKLLTTVAFIYMMRDGVCSPVVLCIILAREFAVSGLRMVAGTLLAHTEGGVPNLIVETSGRTPADLGQLIYFFEYACGLSGYLLDVNPFDQPGVEAYKKNMFALLGKPGYEDRRAQLESKLEG